MDRAFVIHLAVDPVGRLETLATERAPWYGKAHATVDISQKSPEAAADRVLALARERAGWS